MPNSQVGTACALGFDMERCWFLPDLNRKILSCTLILSTLYYAASVAFQLFLFQMIKIRAFGITHTHKKVELSQQTYGKCSSLWESYLKKNGKHNLFVFGYYQSEELMLCGAGQWKYLT